MVKGIIKMTQKIQIKKTVDFLYEIGTMRKIMRAHRQTLLTDDSSDNIATHSFRVAWIGYLLAKLEKADSNKVLLMCLSHDMEEARSGDHNWIHKKYVKVFENEIVADQIKKLPGESELKRIKDEYFERKSKESRIAKDADLIDQMMLLKEYVVIGNKEAIVWIKGKGRRIGNRQFQLLTTATGKKLATEILKRNPTDWWKDVWTEKRR